MPCDLTDLLYQAERVYMIARDGELRLVEMKR